MKAQFNLKILSSAIFFTFLSFKMLAQLPAGFSQETVHSDFVQAIGIEFADTNLQYVFQKNGTVFTVIDNVRETTPSIDLSEEVGDWDDHGMLSIKTDPDFASNGYLYIYYVVDRHHLLSFGSPEYDSDSNDYNSATIARLTRYTMDIANPKNVIGGSRLVLLGDSIGNGVPIMATSHAGGSIQFGADGSLLLSTGDGNAPQGNFTGGSPYPPSAYDSLGLIDGSLSPGEDIGAFRSQYLDGLNGKILRINKANGDGLPGNPWYNAEKPWKKRSKVFALGFRNPYRMAIRPGTGSQVIEDGNPGTLLIGDVGYWSWEEINVVQDPGANCGWPSFEGIDNYWGFNTLPTFNPSEPNELYNGVSCDQEFYFFQDLIRNPSEDHNTDFEHPCNSSLSIPGSVPVYLHNRPAITWKNALIAPPYQTFVPGFDASGESIRVDATDPVEGLGIDQIAGYASIGGTFYDGETFPEEYRGSYFQTDYSGWMKRFVFDENDNLTEVHDWMDNAGAVVQTTYNPFDECLYYVTLFPDQIKKICYGGNQKPTAIIEVDTISGVSPLTIQFTGSTSSDPDSDTLNYAWDFDNGITSSAMDTTITFTAPDQNPYMYTVTLTVTDTNGAFHTVNQIISINNTAPTVDISSLTDGELYSIHEGNFDLNLQANVNDAEHSINELSYVWQAFLHHNTHFHPQPADTNKSTSITLPPVGCQPLEQYWYAVELTVTDAAGLSSTDRVELFADCGVSGNNPNLDENNLELFPNPSTGFVSLHAPIDSNESEAQLDVISALGQVVVSKKITLAPNVFSDFDFSRLDKGAYRIKVTTDKATYTQGWVKY